MAGLDLPSPFVNYSHKEAVNLWLVRQDPGQDSTFWLTSL